MTAAVRARIARVLAGDFTLSRRDDRWLALGQHVAFAADTDTEWARLQTEARLLARWRDAGVPVPRVLEQRDHVQVRERLDGIMGEVVEPLLFGTASLAEIGRLSPSTRAGDPLPWPLPDGNARLDPHCPLSPFGARLARSYGELAAKLHTLTHLPGLAARQPFELDAALAKLRGTPIARALVDKAGRARSWIAKTPEPSCIVHGDLHFHNMCLADDGSIIGVFDIGDAHADGPESEFHYVHSLGPRFVELALEAYGAPLDVEHIRRAHVRTALGHLLFIDESSPRWPAMLSWNTAVLTHLVPDV